MDPVNSADGMRLPFFVPFAEESFSCLKPEHCLGRLTDSFCQQARFRPQTAFESDEPSTIRGLIRAGPSTIFG